MRKIALSVCMMIAFLVTGSSAFAQDDMHKHSSCPLCGMDRHQYAHSSMVIDYDDGTSVGTCSIHCTAGELAANRQKTIVRMYVADYTTKKLTDAREAHWVIGGNKTGVMTKRAKWAFGQKEDAEAFIKENGGQGATFKEAMRATFEDMYEDTKMIRESRKIRQMKMADLRDHPECRYCGMIRQEYAHSRMLIEYGDGTQVGTCSIHCASLDLALNIDKTPKLMMVGDYNTKDLIDAERAFWVIGGKKTGVMTIRGKWAFESKTEAEDFMKENGGRLATFDDAMKATFEDMHEILR
jgi:nitrous oxide reductase accessory protein NosL